MSRAGGRRADPAPSVILVDGRPAQTVPADDRALAYGDGLFETIAIHDAIPQHWALHYARLREGADRLAIPCPPEAVWLQDLARAVGPRPAARSVLKLVLSRGSGPRGYAPPVHANPRRVLSLSPWPAPTPIPRAEWSAIVCRTGLGRNPLLAGIKHLNRLEQVLAAREVAVAGADEGIMLDDRRAVIAGTRTNLFLVIAGRLVTPLVDQCGVAGVMRRVILDVAEQARLPSELRRVSQRDLREAREALVCNSLLGLVPVATLRGQRFTRRYPAREVGERLQCLLAERALLP